MMQERERERERERENEREKRGRDKEQRIKLIKSGGSEIRGKNGVQREEYDKGGDVR